jgi:predicted lipoprotein with Yx(FWY)xxD motif
MEQGRQGLDGRQRHDPLHLRQGREGQNDCYDACAKNWPPFAAAADAKAEGSGRSSTAPTVQDVGYDGKPLTFASDQGRRRDR